MTQHKRKHLCHIASWGWRLALCGLLLGVLAACNGGNATPTEEATAEVTEEATAEVTEETTEEATGGLPEVTLEVDPELIDPDIPPSEANGISVSVVRMDTSGDGVYGLDASVLNNASSVFEIGAGQLVVVGEDGTRYEPTDLPENVQPQLIGTAIEPDTSLRGFAEFEIPDGTDLSHIEVCLDDACETIIGAVIPSIVEG